jgi:cytoskeletal protein CcmA (bactofilin family)
MISILGLFILIAGVLAVPAYALVKSNDTIFVRADEVINDDFFAGGDEVTIEGTINGDVYVGANRLNIRGTVNGDVIAGAQNIEVTGTIRDDLRAGGNNISLIGATIGDSVSVGGNELSIDRDSTIGGGLLFGGRLLALDGSVGRGIMSGTETTRIDGLVGNTVRVAATTINIDRDAVLQGDLEYRSDNEATINGTVVGKIIRGEGGGFDFKTESIVRWFAVGFTAWAFIGAAIIGGLMLLLVPRILPKAHKNFIKKPWPIIGWGTLATLVTIPAMILLFITVVGIPLALVILVLWLQAIYFAKFFVAYTVGQSLIDGLSTNTKKNSSSRAYLALILGLVLYYLLRLLPGIGVFVRFATLIMGIGMMLSLYNRTVKKTLV